MSTVRVWTCLFPTGTLQVGISTDDGPITWTQHSHGHPYLRKPAVCNPLYAPTPHNRKKRPCLSTSQRP